MKCQTNLLAIFSLFLLIGSAQAEILPIVVLHGINSTKADMQECVQLLHEYLGPDVYIKNVEIRHGWASSFYNILAQCHDFAQTIQNDFNLYGGFNLVGHSQGGLITRWYVQEFNSNPNFPHVHNFITLGSPHQGVYGTPSHIDNKFVWLNWFEQQAYYVMYSWFFQKFFSTPQYWHDTCHSDEYRAYCQFLPYLNNEIPHDKSEQYKQNICSLDNFVLVLSTIEEIIEPKESCHFGFYKEDCTNKREALEESMLYQGDHLGLRWLNEQGRLHKRFAHSPHGGLPEDKDCLVKNVVPFLQLEPAAPAA